MAKNWEQIAGQWKQSRGEAKKKWGKLTDDELMQVDGTHEILAGKIQEMYGSAKEDPHQQINEWVAKLKE